MGSGKFWLVKPRIATDIADIPRLEHMAQHWGAASGLNFASTVLHPLDEGFSALRVLRFDRDGARRFMCVSAATLLQTEYPATALETDRWSYPRLAAQLRLIGAPDEDRRELFGRMVFNAVCGNDDDHVRNHAVCFRPDLGGWRLSPAFDVVPNPVDTPRALAMQLATARYDISRAAVLEDARRFGFRVARRRGRPSGPAAGPDRTVFRTVGGFPRRRLGAVHARAAARQSRPAALTMHTRRYKTSTTVPKRARPYRNTVRASVLHTPGWTSLYVDTTSSKTHAVMFQWAGAGMLRR